LAKRIRPAKHYQAPNNAVRQIALGSRRAVAKDLKGAMRHLGALVPDKVETMIRNGNFRGINGEIDWRHWGEVLKKPFARIGKVYEAGAALGVQKINNLFIRHGRKIRFRKAVGDRFNFDLYNDKTVAALRGAQSAVRQHVGWAKRSVPTTAWARRFAPLPTLRAAVNPARG